ncbi:triose-phosphate isomerase [Buchnera aphidicola (Thelaxes californica)]|uniref:Triosephosphate isomerase n=1 Tax=Buchnera aphidicola (Thelaxes californica) TaxID=1315998 RepID=A0A4D6YBL5_9GAMM|nr:triose-phosphate isomerase [Buchnera aphidicola]QCI26769.1 triose-phosphate isomerase [Buchnera aphidicola (Thelaxes californica)]
MKKTIIANWKLNGNKKIITDFLLNVHRHLTKTELNSVNIVIAFPQIYLCLVKHIINDLDLNIHLCSQDVSYNSIGAFTGEVSIHMLKENFVKYVIVGHSERRNFHNENNNIILKKFIKVKESELIPILCVGENLKEKEMKQTELVLKQQITKILDELGNTAFDNTIIAYEPVWAIGTGKSASIEEVINIHKFIKKYIQYYTNNSIQSLSIYYGGSVNEKNIKMLSQQKDVDGLLVGNSSLNSEIFIKMIKNMIY